MFFYQRYKPWVFLILAIAAGTGAVSKSNHGQSWEVILNGTIALISFVVFLFLLMKSKTANGTSSANKGNGWLIVFFTILGALAAAAMIPYQVEAGLLDIVVERSGGSLMTASLLTILQTALITMFASYIGFTLNKQVNLGAPILRKALIERVTPSFSARWLLISIIGSTIGTLLVAVLEVKVFQPLLSISTVIDVTIWKTALLMFYGGIVEEVMLRLGLMTFIVWILSRTYRKQGVEIPSSLYWISILGSAILFGLGHLPATMVAFGSLSAVIVIRALVLNGLLGVFFGYLYWKKGIEYSIIAHMCADLFLHVVWFQVFI